jgi:hypothetical protein
MSKVTKLLTKEQKVKQSKMSFFREVFENWSKMEDLEEIAIVAKVSNGEMRYQLSYWDDNFWWIGALSNLISNVNNHINFNTEDFHEEG